LPSSCAIAAVYSRKKKASGAEEAHKAPVSA
jgi:hypothetical protein